ncbi:aromatic ring-hydroxylating oxygenase subunit alpha [Ramlibacter albus]|uniref:Rieske 2Fe-2S domain-containing protein n=1 Tax=Ramlibacter albus TaxID=2079448 RepID=A0A923M315_9BURK|nr:Rieske 2Fe-2S domain-containing protein [Ramlibacter albus]MBC5762990.1 Rieske 2Fe-2S domain-containing protein [Ramlibacter albus]
MNEQPPLIRWPVAGESRVPYSVFSREAFDEDEQRRIFLGKHWHFVCLEVEVAAPGDFKTTHIGKAPVVISRDFDGEIYGFENRCAHRGALICLENAGNARQFQCVYHAWSYDLQGTLTGVAFEKGVRGLGGMPPSFCKEEHGPRKLRVALLAGLVFASFADDVDPLDEYLGPEIVAKIERVLFKPLEVIGRFTQVLPNNWKLYAENARDTYHASLLHLFFTTFNITRLSQGGGVVISPSGGHHASASIKAPEEERGTDTAYAEQRSNQDGFRLHAPQMLDSEDEIGDGIRVQILTVFPGFVLQQIHNCIAVRQIVPTGAASMDLHWTLVGFADDSPRLREMRLMQANLVGPAGYVSMEDGAVGNFVQRGIAAAADHESVIELGGLESKSQDFRATEASIRGFWKAYRTAMEL